ncbi:ribosomal-processing cysteine protease Prp [Lentibacillus cibarius]|uniref:Ribosomal processing cysteine protease Prp n=1 Tax=Lentibacillus cibarius TaxID=2583219 RepID=A0A549YLS2_9BACI|nr:ribosomal-processing cysteine protease Prp [Lentibacillus cibarius]TMN21074.1 ribosomal-processing cysteine protease Prp [Lentibacillus cibarius]TRM12826.1 ribosomal-processing cysteine protease Prp [Lentibacillus cibarius]
MINIDIIRRDSQIKQFELTGHADSGPYGFDLVCAGVSAVTFGSVNAVLELSEADLEIEQGDEGGFLRVTVPDRLTDDTMKKVQVLFEGMLVSLKTIEREYGDYITIRN